MATSTFLGAQITVRAAAAKVRASAAQQRQRARGLRKVFRRQPTALPAGR
jgi:hypothetical protein